MTIPEALAKIKQAKAKIEEPRVYYSLLLLLAVFASFGLGRLSVEEGRGGGPVRITGGVERTSPSLATQGEAQVAAVALSGAEVYASKNGTKYYYAHCSGLKRILDANRITFTSKEEAESAGFSLASGCVSR